MDRKVNTMEQGQRSRYCGVSAAVSIPALVFFFVFLVMPMLQTGIIAFKAYSPKSGIAASPWVGLANIKEFLYAAQTPRVFANTAVISAAAVLIGGLYVFALTCAIARLRSTWLKALAACAAVLPGLIPAPIWAFALKSTPILQSPALYRLAAIGNEVFCIAPFAALAGALLCGNRFDVKKARFTALGYGAVRLILLFSADTDYIISTYHPMVYETADVIDTYIYRHGIAGLNLSGAAVSYLFKIVFGILPLLVGLTVLFKIAKEKEISRQEPAGVSFKNVGAVILGIPALLFAFVLRTSIPGMDPFTNPLVIRGVANSLVIGVISCAFTLLLAIGLSYAMVNGSRTVLILNAVFLTIGGNMAGQYLQMRTWLLVDTVWAVAVSNALGACLYAYFLFLAFGGFRQIPFGEFIKKAVPGLILLFGIGFARFYGDIVPSMLYVRNRTYFPVASLLREALQMGEGVSMSTAALLMIPVAVAVLSIAGAFWAAAKSGENIG